MDTMTHDPMDAGVHLTLDGVGSPDGQLGGHPFTTPAQWPFAHPHAAPFVPGGALFSFGSPAFSPVVTEPVAPVSSPWLPSGPTWTGPTWTGPGWAGPAWTDPTWTEPAWADPSQVYGTLHGDPNWIHQSGPEDCGEVASRDVVASLTGYAPSEGDVVSYATSRGLLDPAHGTTPAGIVDILGHYGVSASETDDVTAQGTVTHMEQALASGQQVIALVDAAPIWDSQGQNVGDAGHFVVVKGIEDTGDPATSRVVLSDSGVGPETGIDGAHETVSLSLFEQAMAQQFTAHGAAPQYVTVEAGRPDATEAVPSPISSWFPTVR